MTKFLSYKSLGKVMAWFIALVAAMALSSCRDEPLVIPEPPSFDWKASIYQNPIPIDQIEEPACDTLPWFENGTPPFDGYRYYHKSADPVVWKIKLNKSRRDLIAYISYHPDLHAEYQQNGGYAQIQIKDLMSGAITVVDQMTSSAHLGFDFAGDYLIYERDFEGYLYNWKTKEKERLGNKIDHPSISPNSKLISFHDLNFENKGNMIIRDMETHKTIFSIDSRLGGENVIWTKDDELIIDSIAGILKILKIREGETFKYYKGPFGGGVGFLVGLSHSGQFLYGDSYSIIDLTIDRSLRFGDKILLGNCQNRSLANFFILPDNTFMMRKTYFVSDHEDRSVYPEYHWHLFDADGSNERRVDLQL